MNITIPKRAIIGGWTSVKIWIVQKITLYITQPKNQESNQIFSYICQTILSKKIQPIHAKNYVQKKNNRHCCVIIARTNRLSRFVSQAIG